MAGLPGLPPVTLPELRVGPWAALRAARTKYHRLGGSHGRNLRPPVLEAESKTKVRGVWLLSQASLLGTGRLPSLCVLT